MPWTARPGFCSSLRCLPDLTSVMGYYGYFLLWTTLGNACGGSIFVALIKYSYSIIGKMPGAR